MKERDTFVLLDTHAIIHRAYHALPEFTSSKGEPTGALYGLVSFLLKLIREIKPRYIVACYDLPGPTFRHETYREYKATRKKADEALIAQLASSRDIFKAFNIPIYDAPGFEADDIIGTIVESLKSIKSKVHKVQSLQIVIASGDMDTMQLVSGDDVVVYTLKKGINETVIYDEKAMRERFGFAPELLTDYKGLRGDPSDNIPGIPGIGEKTATELVQKFGSLSDIYKNIDKIKKIKERTAMLLKEHEDEAIFSKTLATIRRDAPIQFEFPTPFQETFDDEKAKEMLNVLGFRSLMGRLTAIRGTKAEEKKEQETLSEIEIKELLLALWVLDSKNTDPKIEDMFVYSGKKSVGEAKAFLLSDMKAKGLMSIYHDIELPLIDILERAEKRGICVDTEYLKKLSKEYHEKLDVLQQSVFKLLGASLNLNSPKQLGEALSKVLGKQMKTTKASELEKYATFHPVIQEIFKYRELQKLLSTYIDNIQEMVDENSRLHTRFIQWGTTTGRMASENPNLQNLPTKTELGRAIKKAFVAAPGYSLVSFDYSQIELRVAAMLSGDPNLIKSFIEGGDIHRSVAAKIFHVAEHDVTEEMRRKAKVLNFGILYGMGVGAIRASLGTTLLEARAFYTAYFERFPRLADYLREVVLEAGRVGYTRTLYGRRRYFSELKTRIPYMRAQAERMAVNAPIQGSAADLAKRAMCDVDRMLKKERLDADVLLLLQIHDELVYEIKEEVRSRAIPLVRHAMEGVYQSDVPLIVDVKHGNTL